MEKTWFFFCFTTQALLTSVVTRSSGFIFALLPSSISLRLESAVSFFLSSPRLCVDSNEKKDSCSSCSLPDDTNCTIHKDTPSIANKIISHLDEEDSDRSDTDTESSNTHDTDTRTHARVHQTNTDTENNESKGLTRRNVSNTTSRLIGTLNRSATSTDIKMAGIEQLVTQVKQSDQDEIQLSNKGGASNNQSYSDASGDSSWWFVRWVCCCFKSSSTANKSHAPVPLPVTNTSSFPNKNSSASTSQSVAVANTATSSRANEYAAAFPKYLLPTLNPKTTPKKCLVLDLDETLVHSSFKYIPDADFIIEIDLDGSKHTVYVRKRPGVDLFLKEVAKKWELVIFTASLSKYADPLLDVLDADRLITSRLFRESCVHYCNNYVKDLSHLGRELSSSVIIDNSPYSYMFQTQNAIAILSWFMDKSDKKLFELIPFLDELADQDDVVTALANSPHRFG